MRFAGQYYDAETGLHYNYHRYYDPQLGRYLRADPIGLVGGINPYVYVQNNPLNSIDLFGLDDILITKGEVHYRNDKDKIQFTLPANSGLGIAMNNPEMQDISDIGPTPEGTYYIDISNNAEPDKTYLDDYGWGLYAWEMEESFFTKVKRKVFTDRSGGFYLHQDQYNGNMEGTLGCTGVVGDDNITKLKKALEKYSSKKNKIKVTVKY